MRSSATGAMLGWLMAPDLQAVSVRRDRGSRRARLGFVVAVLAIVAMSACASSITPSSDAGFDSGSDARDPSAEAIARFCVLYAACMNPGEPTDSPGCAESISAFAYADMTDAARQAAYRYVFGCSVVSSCDSFRSCLLGGRDPSYCSTHPALSCEGDTLVSCSPTGNFALDCTTYGLHCTTTPSGAICSDGSTCTMSGVGAECQGNRLVMCAPGGFVSGADCSLFLTDGVCVSGAAGGACVPMTPCADGGAGSHCEGTAAVSCTDGHEVRVECASVPNGVCAPSDASLVTLSDLCVVSDATCDARTTADRCSGTSVESCVQGHFVSVDCTTFGQRTCAAVAGGVTCVP